MYERHATRAILQALADTPVVLLNGARQTGKTTLVSRLAAGGYATTIIGLDDAATLAAARSDPVGFVAGLGDSVVLDEVQRAPDLFLAIKAEVDRRRLPGRFLLTGSANILLQPNLPDSLAGRLEVVPLWPLSQGEIEGVREGFIDALLSPSAPAWEPSALETDGLLQLVLRGGFPEAVSRKDAKRRAAWFSAYLSAIVQRDIRDLAAIRGLHDLPRLLTMLATRTGAVLNTADLSRATRIAQSTLKRYLMLLEAAFLIDLLPAWNGPEERRLVKHPRVFVTDSGLAAFLQGADLGRLRSETHLLGPLVQTFVYLELRKQLGWTDRRVHLHHFRTAAGVTVDIVVESADGRVAGIDIRDGSTITPADLRGLQTLAEIAGDRFVRGVVLYPGATAVPFSDRIAAVPISALWQRQIPSL